MTYYPKIGSVSEGTLRTEDLLDTFAGELSYHMKRMRLSREQRARFTSLLAESKGYHAFTDDLSAIVDALSNALCEIAAPYSFFGANDGDGACFGYWPYIDDELDRLVDGDPISAIYYGEEVLLVNDHGNVRCGLVNKRGKFTEYWSCV